jgi:hypothetical protein
MFKSPTASTILERKKKVRKNIQINTPLAMWYINILSSDCMS